MFMVVACIYWIFQYMYGNLYHWCGALHFLIRLHCLSQRLSSKITIFYAPWSSNWVAYFLCIVCCQVWPLPYLFKCESYKFHAWLAYSTNVIMINEHATSMLKQLFKAYDVLQTHFIFMPKAWKVCWGHLEFGPSVSVCSCICS